MAGAPNAMPSSLQVSLGQYSDKGRKAVNQDFHGALIPEGMALISKGLVLALADGIGSSNVSHIASETAVSSFLEDYFSTPETWSVRQSAQRVINATNAWLHAQTRQGQYRYDLDRGYVCTFTALVIKGDSAHCFHLGDARLYRLSNGVLEQLTEDHRLWVSREQSYLSRALGMNARAEIDHLSMPVTEGDWFVLATDGVHEYLDTDTLTSTLASQTDPRQAARTLAALAYERGSEDNLTVQVLRVDRLPRDESSALSGRLDDLPLPPELHARMEFDGFRILRELHASSRSHVYLAEDLDSGVTVVLKTPAIDRADDRAFLERFMMEEWIAHRIDHPHVLKAPPRQRQRRYLYTVTDYVDGKTLTQWMRDHPSPSLETVRGLVEQIARALYAFHRREILHQDLRPENVMVDANGTVTLIDFGAARVAGLAELAPPRDREAPQGTLPYMAPEYFLGEPGDTASDLFSLGVITYQLLTGDLPYGTAVSQCRTRAAQNRLRYRSALRDDRDLPAWVDGTLRKAVHPHPDKRYRELSEFIHDLRHPNPGLAHPIRAPLMERHPVRFWQSVSAVLALLVVLLAVRLYGA